MRINYKKFADYKGTNSFIKKWDNTFFNKKSLPNISADYL
jgi:hypothetical protein